MDIVLQTSFNNPALPTIPLPGFFDNFNRSDAAFLGNTSREGKEWLRLVNSTARGSVVSQRASNPSPAGNQVEVVDALRSDGTLTATMVSASDRVTGLAFRAIDSANYYRLGTRVSSSVPRYTIQMVKAGATTTIVSSSISSADGDVVTIQMAGTGVAIKANGVDLFPAQVLTDFATATKHGFYWGAASTALWDNIGFEPS